MGGSIGPRHGPPDQIAWTEEDGTTGPQPSASKDANAYGLFDTLGNVWEWCQDAFDPAYYASSPTHDPAGPTSASTRVIRGGSYLCHDSYCNRYRVAARSANTPDSSTGNTGFRTVDAG